MLVLYSLHPSGLQTPAAVTQCEWFRARAGPDKTVGRRDVSLVSVPLCLSFVKWEKGKCERRGRKGDLAKGFLGQVNCREKYVWTLSPPN